MIPNNIIQFWDDASTLPELLKKSMEVTQKCNPDAKVIIADDAYMREFIEKHYNTVLLRLYNLNRIPASRADIARLLLLYEYGGFYVDVSLELNKSIMSLVDVKTDLVLVRRDDFPQYKDSPENAHVINGMMGVKPKSEFVKWCIQRVLRNLASEDTNRHVFMATGPVVINQAFSKFEASLNVNKLSFKELNDRFFFRHRVLGVNNVWTQEQQFGIIDPEYYLKNCRQYEKTFVFMNRIFNFSLRSLSLK